MTSSFVVLALRGFAGEMDRGYDSCADVPPEHLATVLAAIRDCRADLAALASRVEGDLLAVAGEKRFVVDGLGEVQIRKHIKRSDWDNEDLTRKVVALALDERVLNEQTGEYEPAHEAVARVLSECARPSWRVTPLRSRGIDVSEYCREEFDAYQVQLPPRAT